MALFFNQYPAKLITALAANTTLNTTHFGGIITNRGAVAATVHTLPEPTAALAGAWFEYFGVVGQDVTFQTTTPDTFLVPNDAAADSVAFSTGGQRIGAHAVFVCDGTSWIASDFRFEFTIAT